MKPQWAERRAETTDAFELYLLARERQRQRTADDNLKAIEYFRRAVAADPKFAPALTGLAESLLNGLSLNRMPLEDVEAEAEPLINRASQLSPNAPHVLAVKGWLLTEEFRIDEALPLLQQAIKGNPNDASLHRFMGDLYDRRAQPGEALEHFSAAAELDPDGFHFACVPLHGTRRPRRVRPRPRAACQRARELDTSHMWGPLATAWIARAQGNTDEALRWIDEARKLAARRHQAGRPENRAAVHPGPSRRSARGHGASCRQNGSFFARAREGEHRLRRRWRRRRSRPGWRNTKCSTTPARARN